MTAPNADLLIEQLKFLIQKPESFSHDDSKRAEIERLGRLASRALETPEETMRRLIFSPLPLITTRIGQDFNLFSTLAQHSESRPASISDLSKATGLEKSILTAIMDYNGGQGVSLEVKSGFYAPTKLTHLLLQPAINDAILTFHDCVLPTFAALHGVLKSTGAADSLTAFQAGHNTSEKDIYVWLEDHPVQQGAFYRFMKTVNAGLPTWLDVVRFDEEVGVNAKPDEILFVDVGGGFGWQCRALRRTYPQLPGRVILQDRSDVITKAQGVEDTVPFSQLGIEAVGYDFFTAQLVKGARAYYLGMILHNWDDDACLKILRQQAAAMTENSVLLVEDYVLGERAAGAHYAAAFGIAMQAVHNARERSREDFVRLFGLVGLELDEIRVVTQFGISILFARKKTDDKGITDCQNSKLLISIFAVYFKLTSV
ncbi:S-adenosyl-L-methionine-dependent methyltransferase [Melanomma pulvis-pyrius CBS 109.77]|uniref:S-adenosyl-L-methionine-dependent methyltransferase n=1 Tax=Melanomma pulvis-pyrius CBS 109.77 TaxID=1314802 RepID=A0A6A6XG39_9PLEO|nr:S-adenosyl-L-methionine-dependent methyltransferase [Melanomma pulvis-pyrius CBS 109.77]